MNIFLILLLFFFCLKECDKISKDTFEVILIIIIVCSIIVYLLYFIFVSICLDIHIKYITKFMNKINLDFIREKNDFKWNLILLIYKIIFLAIPIIILFLYNFYDSNYSEYGRSIYHSNATSSNDININNKEIKRLKKENKEKDEKINELNIKVFNLENTTAGRLTLNKIEPDVIKLRQELEKLKEVNQSALESITKKDKEINILKASIPFDIKEGEKVMLVIFQSPDDANIHHPFLCINKHIFNTLENQLYAKVPEYKEKKTYFLANSQMVVKTKSLEENNIKDGDIIFMCLNNFDD